MVTAILALIVGLALLVWSAGRFVEGSDMTCERSLKICQEIMERKHERFANTAFD